jgi:hypothetical protein
MDNFIDKEFLIKNTNIQKNVLEVDRYINEATLLYIQPQLGISYFKVLLSNFNEGRVLVDTLEYSVLELVKLASAYYTVSLILPNIHYKFTETSVITKSGGDNTSVEGRELQYLITLNKQQGDRFMDRALDIIKDNINMFPYFKIRNCDRTENNTFGGFLL